MRTERQKMQAGEWYRCVDPELDAQRAHAAEAVHQHNTLPPHQRGDIAPLLAALIRAHAGSRIEAPFHCAYGFNLSLEGRVFINTGAVILDTAPVRIGDGSMLGPSVHIYCADHHHDPALRASGLERGLPVIIGSNVWIGGGAIILPGVTIGDDAIVGAGSVVTKAVAAGTTVAGNPARVIKQRG
jgi:maltose O-acetyltransferase